MGGIGGREMVGSDDIEGLFSNLNDSMNFTDIPVLQNQL